MSHSVHYIFPSSCLESDALIESPLLPEALAADLRKREFPAESEMTFERDVVRVAFSLELGFGVLWTNINYARFLHDNERVRTVDSIDRWLRTWCAAAARVDELFVDKWFARLEAEPPTRPVSLSDFTAWLGDVNPEQTHWVLLPNGVS